MALFARILKSDVENVKDLRSSVKTAEPTYQETMEDKRQNTPRSESQAVRDYPDPKYHNQKGMVSPLNILVMDYINSIANMSFDEAVAFVIDNILAINSKYQGDIFYDTFSEASGGYLRKMEYAMKNTIKPRNIEGLIMYLQNAMMKGMTKLNELDDDIGNSLMDEFSEKGSVKCENYNDFIHVMEFLYLHDEPFKVTNINSAADTCIIRRV